MLINYRKLRSLDVPYSKSTVERLVKEGKFPAPVKFNGPKSRNFWDEQQVIDYVASLKATSTASKQIA